MLEDNGKDKGGKGQRQCHHPEWTWGGVICATEGDRGTQTDCLGEHLWWRRNSKYNTSGLYTRACWVPWAARRPVWPGQRGRVEQSEVRLGRARGVHQVGSFSDFKDRGLYSVWAAVSCRVLSWGAVQKRVSPGGLQLPLRSLFARWASSWHLGPDLGRASPLSDRSGPLCLEHSH